MPLQLFSVATKGRSLHNKIYIVGLSSKVITRSLLQHLTVVQESRERAVPFDE